MGGEVDWAWRVVGMSSDLHRMSVDTWHEYPEVDVDTVVDLQWTSSSHPMMSLFTAAFPSSP